MIFLNSKNFNFLVIFLLFLNCSNPKDISISDGLNNRTDMLEKYIKSKKGLFNIPNNVNIYFLYSSNNNRCTCQPINEIVVLLKEYKDNVVILNEEDSATIKNLYKYAEVYVDNKTLRKYGLMSPVNQLFIVRDNKVIYKTMINVDNQKKVLKQVKINN